MTLLEGLQYKGRPFHIPGTGRAHFPEFLVKMGYKVGAEIGVHMGDMSKKFCKAGLKMYSVDPYLAFSGQGNSSRNQAVQDDIYKHAKHRLSRFDCTLIRKKSMDAVKDFKRGSLDFVYIDGDHSFRYVAEDIVEWNRIVRRGGCVSGHDYFNVDPNSRTWAVQVKAVVDAFMNYYQWDFYTFGEQAEDGINWMVIR